MSVAFGLAWHYSEYTSKGVLRAQSYREHLHSTRAISAPPLSRGPRLEVLALAPYKVVEEIAQHLRDAGPEFVHHKGVFDALAQVREHTKQQSRLGYDGMGWNGVGRDGIG